MMQPLLGVGSALVIGLTVAGQIFALQCHQDAALGIPLIRVGWWAIYPPWGIVTWAWAWGATTGITPWRFSLLGGGVAALFVLSQLARKPSRPSGQAHWATKRELRHAECVGTPGSGVVLGKRGRTMLRYHGEGHCFFIGRTGGGKTATLISTLLESPAALVAYDPTDSVFPHTAGYRATLGPVLRFAPFDAHTDCHNPLSLIRLGTDDEFADAELVAQYHIEPESSHASDATSKHFQDLAMMVTTGTMLYGLHSGLATTGAALNDLVTRTTWPDLVTVLQHDPHPAVQQAGDLASRPGKDELGSLQTTLARAFRLYMDPRIAHVTSHSSYPLTTLREADAPASIYVTVPFAHLRRLRPLLRLFFCQVIEQMTAHVDGWKHPLLFAIDEVTSLDRLDILSEALDFVRKYQIRLLVCTPSMERLIAKYGQHHNWLEGSYIQLVLGLNDERVAERFSKRVGTHKVTQRRVTRQAGGQQSTTEEVRNEPLLSPTGLVQLPQDSVLVLAGKHSLVASQTRFFDHEPWRTRSQLPLPGRTP